MQKPVLLVSLIHTPLGPFTIAETAKGLYRIDFDDGKTINKIAQEKGFLIQLSTGRSEAERQITEYLQGKRKKFDLTLDISATPFRMKVWQALMDIPYGETRSYMDIAKKIGCEKGSRAVGQANAANPVPIVVPCHRVIAADGSLGGYSGGLPIKQFLLDLEKRYI